MPRHPRACDGYSVLIPSRLVQRMAKRSASAGQGASSFAEQRPGQAASGASTHRSCALKPFHKAVGQGCARLPDDPPDGTCPHNASASTFHPRRSAEYQQRRNISSPGPRKRIGRRRADADRCNQLRRRSWTPKLIADTAGKWTDAPAITSPIN